MYTPVNHSFTILKWSLRGSKLYRHVLVMVSLSLSLSHSLFLSLSLSGVSRAYWLDKGTADGKISYGMLKIYQCLFQTAWTFHWSESLLFAYWIRFIFLLRNLMFVYIYCSLWLPINLMLSAHSMKHLSKEGIMDQTSIPGTDCCFSCKYSATSL